MNNSIIKIGITGGIGSGKTVASKIFSLLGIPVYNADDRAKWLLLNNENVRNGVIRLFGEQAFVGQTLNRTYISQQIFNNKEKLEQLNDLVHPEVARDFENWLEGKEKFPYILKEAALLFEAGSYKLLDKIITVQSPIDLKIKRIPERDPHRTKEDILKIMGEQMEDKEKVKRADFVIVNDETKMLIPQVIEIDRQLRAEH